MFRLLIGILAMSECLRLFPQGVVDFCSTKCKMTLYNINSSLINSPFITRDGALVSQKRIERTHQKLFYSDLRRHENI